MIIRPYSPDDEQDVLQLWFDCGLVVPQNSPERDIERKMDVNPEFFLVGEIDDRIVATCMAGYEGHRGWIYYLAVSPGLRHKSLGKAIVVEAEKLLKDAGCPKINLQIRASNSHVIAFYKSLGYGEDHVISLGKRLEED